MKILAILLLILVSCGKTIKVQTHITVFETGMDVYKGPRIEPIWILEKRCDSFYWRLITEKSKNVENSDTLIPYPVVRMPFILSPPIYRPTNDSLFWE